MLVKIAGAVLILMMLHIVADIAGKYLFLAPVPGTMETVAAYYMVLIVLFPIAAVTLEESHVKVEIFTRFLQIRALAKFEIVSALLCLVFVVALTWGGFHQALLKTKRGEMWETAVDAIYVWPSRWIIPVGMGLAAFAFVIVLTRWVRRARHGALPEQQHNESSIHDI